MKKQFSILSIAVAMAMFASCSKQADNTTSTDESETIETIEEATPEAAPEEVAPEAAPEATAEAAAESADAEAMKAVAVKVIKTGGYDAKYLTPALKATIKGEASEDLLGLYMDETIEDESVKAVAVNNDVVTVVASVWCEGDSAPAKWDITVVKDGDTYKASAVKPHRK